MPRRCRINCQVPTQTELAGSEAPVLLSFWNASFRPQTQLKLSSSVMWSRTLSGRMCGRSTPLFKLHSSCPTKLLKLMGEIKRPTCVSFARAKERAANTHISCLCAKGCSLKGMAFESLQLKKKKKLSRHWNKLPCKSLSTLPTDPPPNGGLEERHKCLCGVLGSIWEATGQGAPRRWVASRVPRLEFALIGWDKGLEVGGDVVMNVRAPS